MRWELPKWLTLNNKRGKLLPQQPQRETLPPANSPDLQLAQQKNTPEISPETKATATTVVRLFEKGDPRAISWLLQMEIDVGDGTNLEKQIAEKLAHDKTLRRNIKSTIARNGTDTEKSSKIKSPRTPITSSPLVEATTGKVEPRKTVTVAFGNTVLVPGDGKSQQALVNYIFEIIKNKDIARGIAKKITHLSNHPNEIKAFMTQFVHEHALPAGADTTIEYSGYRIFLAFDYAEGGGISAIEILSSSGTRGNLYSKTKSGNGVRG